MRDEGDWKKSEATKHAEEKLTSDIGGNTGMKASSGQSFLTEKRFQDYRYESNSNYHQPYSSLINNLGNEMRYPKKDYSINYEKTEISRTEPIRVNHDVPFVSRYDISDKKYESTYFTPQQVNLQETNRFDRDSREPISYHASKYLGSHYSPISKHLPLSDPTTAKRPSPGASYYKDHMIESSYMTKESIYAAYNPSTTTSAFNSQFDPGENFTNREARDDAINKKIQHFKELLHQIKREEEMAKEKQKALEEELTKKRRQQMVYDPEATNVDYLDVLRKALAKRSKSSQVLPSTYSSRNQAFGL